MARDTRGPVPYGHSDLRRVSLNRAHWSGAQWMLGVESIAASVIGAAGLIGVYAVRPRGLGMSAVGLDMTPALSWTLIGVGAAAGITIMHRRLATVFCFAVGAASLTLVIIGGVASTHHHPGPLGFTPAATMLYSAFFCANLAIGMWLLPNNIEGPAWHHAKNRSEDDLDGCAGDQS